jgi:hypothetical protein
VSWGRQDDAFYDHRKVRAMPKRVRNAACGLYWRAVSLSNHQLSDGWLTPSDISLIDGSPSEVRALLAAGLWDRTRNGKVRIHDFLDFNKSKAQILEERAKRAEAGRLGGLASGRSRTQA